MAARRRHSSRPCGANLRAFTRCSTLVIPVASSHDSRGVDRDCHRRVRRCRGGRGSTARVPVGRRPPAAASRDDLGRGRRALRPAASGGHDPGERRPVAGLRGRRASWAQRAGPQRRPGTEDRPFPHRAEAWTEAPLPDTLPRHKGPGWRGGPEFPIMHEVFGSEAAEGLAEAYRARDVLGLESDTVARIRDQIGRVAASPGWRWPAIRLNQFNWPVRDVRRRRDRQRQHRAAGARVGAPPGNLPRRRRRAWGAAGNLGPGCAFTTCPRRARGIASTSTRPSTRTSCWASRATTALARAAGMARADADGAAARRGSGARSPATGPTAAT